MYKIEEYFFIIRYEITIYFHETKRTPLPLASRARTIILLKICNSRIHTIFLHRYNTVYFSPTYLHLSLSQFSIVPIFKTVLSPFKNLSQTLFRATLLAEHGPAAFRYFLRTLALRVAMRRVALSAGSRASATWRGTYTRASAGVETLPEKGRPRLYVPVGNSVLMPHGISFHVDVPPLYVKLHHTQNVYARARTFKAALSDRTRNFAGSPAVIRESRDAIRVSGSAPRDDRVRRCISRLLLQFNVMWLAWYTVRVALSKLVQIKC